MERRSVKLLKKYVEKSRSLLTLEEKMKKFLLGVILPLGLLIGCNFNDTGADEVEKEENEDVVVDTDITDEEAVDEAEEEELEPPEEKEREYVEINIGEPVVLTSRVGEYEFTVNSIVKYEEIFFERNPHTHTTPNSDYYIIVEMTVTNLGSRYINSGAFSKSELYGETMNKDSWDFEGVVKGDYGDIEPGETSTFETLFDIDESPTYRLEFDDSYMNEIKVLEFTLDDVPTVTDKR